MELCRHTWARHLALMHTLVPVHAIYPRASQPGRTYLQSAQFQAVSVIK